MLQGLRYDPLPTTVAAQAALPDTSDTTEETPASQVNSESYSQPKQTVASLAASDPSLQTTTTDSRANASDELPPPSISSQVAGTPISPVFTDSQASAAVEEAAEPVAPALAGALPVNDEQDDGSSFVVQQELVRTAKKARHSEGPLVSVSKASVGSTHHNPLLSAMLSPPRSLAQPRQSTSPLPANNSIRKQRRVSKDPVATTGSSETPVVDERIAPKANLLSPAPPRRSTRSSPKPPARGNAAHTGAGSERQPKGTTSANTKEGTPLLQVGEGDAEDQESQDRAEPTESLPHDPSPWGFHFSQMPTD